MGKRLVFFIGAMVWYAMAVHAQTVFINEFHYDNSGTDVSEGIEIAGPAGTDLDCYQLVLYNGADGTRYTTLNLSGTIPDQCSGFGTVWFGFTLIQNGAPDGFALVFDPSLSGCSSAGVLTVVQFLSYEGTFLASDGPANGMTSTSVGVDEIGSTPIGQSLQLTGTGTDYTNFTWQLPSPHSNGTVNPGQVFGVGPTCAAIVPTQLTFSGMPTGCLIPGQNFSFDVCATNSSGTVDNSFNSPITIALASGTPPLNGTLTVAAVNGCASFTGLSLSALGGFVFSATGGILNNNSSAIYTSPQCTTCPNLEGAFIDACGPTEGNNEILIYSTGDYFIPVTSSNISISYGTGSPPATNYTNNLTTNQTYVDALNVLAACAPNLFVDALSNSPLPPNSTFLVMRFDPTNVYDFSAWCGQGPIYLLFSADPDWNSTGNFLNCDNNCIGPTPPGSFPRYFRSDFSALGGGAGCDFTSEYTPCTHMTCLGDGDGISWGYGGGTPNLSWNECTPLSLLPVTYSAELQGEWIESEIAGLSWETAQESNSAYFAVERAVVDVEEFHEVGRLAAAGNATTPRSYNFMDRPVAGHDVLYRLRQVDLDGSATLSNVVQLHSESAPMQAALQIDSEAQVLLAHGFGKMNNGRLVDMQGRTLKELGQANEHLEISLSGLSAGVYFLTLQGPAGVQRLKFVYLP